MLAGHVGWPQQMALGPWDVGARGQNRGKGVGGGMLRVPGLIPPPPILWLGGMGRWGNPCPITFPIASQFILPCRTGCTGALPTALGLRDAPQPSIAPWGTQGSTPIPICTHLPPPPRRSLHDAGWEQSKDHALGVGLYLQAAPCRY